MILGVGIDLVNIEEIAASVQNDAFRRKVFTTAEIAACEALANPAEHYAGKFAAKEALMKAIGKGIRQEAERRSLRCLVGSGGNWSARRNHQQL